MDMHIFTADNAPVSRLWDYFD